MRFKSSRYLESRKGEFRVVSRFLWLPESFGFGQVRWLEWAPVIEQVQEVSRFRRYAMKPVWDWRGVGFVDDPEQIGMLLSGEDRYEFIGSVELFEALKVVVTSPGSESEIRAFEVLAELVVRGLVDGEMFVGLARWMAKIPFCDVPNGATLDHIESFCLKTGGVDA